MSSSSSSSSSAASSTASISDGSLAHSDGMQTAMPGNGDNNAAGPSDVVSRQNVPLESPADGRDNQTWAEFLLEARGRGNGPAAADRVDSDNSSFAGRKRRFNGSGDSAGRARGQDWTRQYQPATTPGPGEVRQPAMPNEPASGVPGSSRGTPIDISSPPQPVSRQINSLRHRQSSFTDYRLPRWQPDSEVSQCPICGTTFSFWHRKHHCRKCGRVVCASCSPHRITIPRQFIVRSPDAQRTLSTIIHPSPSARQVINLVDDEEEEENPSYGLNPALGGGEEVRLCNPCVPDPNPEPPRRYSSTDYGPVWTGEGPQGRPDNRFSASYRHRPSASLPSSAFPNPQRPSHVGGHGAPSYASYGVPNVHHSPPPYISLESARRQAQPPPHTYSYPGTSSSGFRQRSSHQSSRTVSVNQRHYNADLSASRARPLPRLPAEQYASVNEEDICPVCNMLLPPRGPDGNEDARESHVRGCIQRLGGDTEPTSQDSLPLGMVHFDATEKDCVGQDGLPQECTICMEEYEVGVKLTRLECLCKFHKSCIIDWFRRKQECPVHKVA